MKISKPITLWDNIEQAVIDLSGTDDPIEVKKMEAPELVDKLIELAYHYRLECNRYIQEREDNAWM
jgi:hypothetical protein